MSVPRQAESSSPSRTLARLLDASIELVWVFDASQRVAWINRPAAQWLGAEPSGLIGRQCIASSTSSDPLDQVAAAIAPPAALGVGVLRTLDVSPPGVAPMSIAYLRIGEGETSFMVAFSTPAPATAASDSEFAESQRLRERIHQWRKRDAAWGGIVTAGSSKLAKRLRGQVQLATTNRHDFSVVGPVGCGAELIARRIHAITATPIQSPGRTSERLDVDPLIAIDGPLMDAELLEASLSPAAAHLGRETDSPIEPQLTLLIRGLDETPLDVQQRIEQFLTEYPEQIRFVGLLAQAVDEATKKQLIADAIAARLSVLTLNVAPLADRIDDVPLMAAALVDARHAGTSGSAERLNRAALDRLTLYPWPGNFDELDAAIRQAMTVCKSAAILPEHLPLAIRSYQPAEPGKSKTAPVETNLDQALESLELKMIRAAVAASDGNRSEAARRLGISRARLIRRLDESPES